MRQPNGVFSWQCSYRFIMHQLGLKKWNCLFFFCVKETKIKKNRKTERKVCVLPSIPRMEFFNSGGLKSVVLLKKMPLVDHFLCCLIFSKLCHTKCRKKSFSQNTRKFRLCEIILMPRLINILHSPKILGETEQIKIPSKKSRKIL